MPTKAKETTKVVGGLEVDAAVPTKNINGIEFIEVNEQSRLYEFPNGRELVIEGVKYVNVSKSRGHRLLTVDGKIWYIKPHESWFMVMQPHQYPVYDNTPSITF